MVLTGDGNMEVKLFVYDLSNGIARAMSMALLGTQIDAVYHTSIVMNGAEYVYDGGIKSISPGNSHLGKPLQVLALGSTELPLDVITEYLQSLKDIYTAEAYDIWSHNCNNFSNDFATFLLGKGIPSHITNLPQTVLNTPFGRAIQLEINGAVKKRQQNTGGFLGIGNRNPASSTNRSSQVRTATTVAELDKLLEEADRSCAVVFFTSAACAACKKLYSLYEDLAADAGNRAVFILVDVSRSYDVGVQYSIRATPTFSTYLHGANENRWSGGEPTTLKGNVQMLVQMAWPPHPHTQLNLPALRSGNAKPVLYSKVPPLGKLRAKMGQPADDASVLGVMHFISARADEGAAQATLPDLDAFSRFLRSAPSKFPPEIIFTIIDVLRVGLIDPRFSGYYAEEKDHKTIAPLLSYVNNLEICPYSLRLVTLQMACNLFSTSLYPPHILSCPTLTKPIVKLITTSLLDVAHHNLRVAAASLAFNMTTASSTIRLNQKLEALPSEFQVELAASLLEGIRQEEHNADALKGYLLAFGWLVYCVPKDSEMLDFLKSLDAEDIVKSKKNLLPEDGLMVDIMKLLTCKGLE